MPRPPERFHSEQTATREKTGSTERLFNCSQRAKVQDVRLSMFTATFGQQVIRARHPLIVVAGETVLGSFSTLAAAEEFIATQSSGSALVLRHQGQEWVIAGDRLVEPQLQVAKAGLTRADRAPAPGLRGATLISNIEAALQNYPHVTYLAGLHYLEVPAQTRNGFRLWIRQRAGRYSLGFEKWHQEFAQAAPAFDFFMFGLSRVCRLRVLSCGGVDYKWQVQRHLDRRWVTVSESGLVFYPFWLKRRERFLQNNIINIA